MIDAKFNIIFIKSGHFFQSSSEVYAMQTADQLGADVLDNCGLIYPP